jgi:MFS family permease
LKGSRRIRDDHIRLERDGTGDLTMTTEPDQASSKRRHGVLWRHADFVKLWIGETVSLIGTQVTAFAVPYTAITFLGARENQLGLLRATEWLPFLFLSLLVGTWVDHHRRRAVMMLANAARAAVVALAPLLYFAGALRIWHLYAVMLLVGIGTVFFELAYLSYLPSLVRREHLVEGNSKLSASQSGTGIAGPGVAGILVQLIRAPATLLVDAASYLASVISLLLIRTPEPEPERKAGRGLRGLRGDIADGLRVVRDNVYLRTIAVEGFTYNLFVQFGATLFLYYAITRFHFSAGAIGLMISTSGIGALLGSLVAPRVIDRIGFGPAFLWGTAFGCAAIALVPLAAGPRWLVTAMLVGSYFGGGFGVTIAVIGSITLRQSVTSDEMLGRMHATMRLATYAAVPIGSLVAGFLSTRFGPRTALAIGSLGLALPVLMIALSPIPRLRELTDSSPAAQEPVRQAVPGAPADGSPAEPS